eukprot:3910691-Pyramimonas_sp.AAC.1
MFSAISAYGPAFGPREIQKWVWGGGLALGKGSGPPGGARRNKRIVGCLGKLNVQGRDSRRSAHSTFGGPRKFLGSGPPRSAERAKRRQKRRQGDPTAIPKIRADF